MGKRSLSIIVPVFNMERYVRLCIESLLAQTYAPLQIILVDDCSKDSSLSILRDYENKYPDRILVIDSKENLRQGGARNLGIRASNSDYIGFVDADDFVHPQMYELLMAEAEKNDVDAVYCGYREVDEAAAIADLSNLANIVSNSDVESMYKKLTDDDRMEIMMSHRLGSVWGGVYRRNLIEENGLYFPEHLAYEDNFWVYALQMNMEDVSFVNGQLYYYRQQEESTIHKRNAIHHYDRIEIEKRFLKYVTDKQLLKRYYKIVEYLFIEVFTMNTYSLLVNLFDHPKADKLEQVKGILKNTFPHWRRNEFYVETFSTKRKLKMNLIMYLPTKIYISLMKRG